MQDAGRRKQAAGGTIQVAGCRVPVAGRRAQGAGRRVQGAGRRAQGAGCRVLRVLDGLHQSELLELVLLQCTLQANCQRVPLTKRPCNV